MSAAKTDAQRQAERKARQLAAGLVQFKAWVYAEDVPKMRETAEKLKKLRVPKNTQTEIAAQ